MEASINNWFSQYDIFNKACQLHLLSATTTLQCSESIASCDWHCGFRDLRLCICIVILRWQTGCYYLALLATLACTENLYSAGRSLWLVPVILKLKLEPGIRGSFLNLFKKGNWSKCEEFLTAIATGLFTARVVLASTAATGCRHIF